MQDGTTLAALAVVTALVLILPFAVRKVEEELEAFLLLMGAAAMTLSGGWSVHAGLEALREPAPITLAVLVFGLAFRRFRPAVGRAVKALASGLGLPAFAFALVAGLGLASSAITAIVAALVLVEAVSVLRLDRAAERRLVILACYAIGLGAALTPIGEPLSTLATSRLAGPPHHAGFFFLARLLLPWLLPGLLLLGLLAAAVARGARPSAKGLEGEPDETLGAVLLRAGRAYVFVAALVLLGTGLSPLVDRWLAPLPADALYWCNVVSAALDNATLAAAEISPLMDLARVRAALIGLLVAGGMLIPGNVPNIVSAGKLGIKSREWARDAAPLGLALMAAYWAALKLVG